MNNHHQNARTTFHSRALIVRRVLKDGMSAKEVGDQFGVSQRTVYKWLARFRAGGVGALHNRTSRPLRSPRRLPVERVATIAAMRRMGMTSPAIAFALCLPLSSVGLGLRRLGLNRLSRLEPKPPVMRYEHKKPGDIIRLDIKNLGRIGRVGHRTPETGPGISVVLVGSICTSAMTTTAVLLSANCYLMRRLSVSPVLDPGVGWFKRHGVKVDRVLTD